ncbi:isochorismatase family cysteine hydrolase [Desulfolucanica intricata]|uniref:isochorismatase family cysteine hydrolase n=1 Tax=Desulfolucanica intricata TaxID=1285191 RepID=UPI00082F7EEA|nr:isochorismatase family cysteine hydrolase [Desulfolucanica intricata]
MDDILKERSKALLVIVDMLKDFLDPEGKLYCGDKAREIIPFVKNLIESFKKSNNDIIFICDSHRVNDKEFEKFPPHCVEGTEGALVIDELNNYVNNNIIRKNRYSAFFNTEFEEFLLKGNYDEVHVVGVCTNICVLYTVEELCNREIKTIVYKQGVQSFDENAHKYALQQMELVLGAKIK